MKEKEFSMREKLIRLLALGALVSMVLSACTAPAGSTAPSTSSEAPAAEAQATEAPAEEAATTDEGAFTTLSPILGDLKVRQAIAHCIDRDALIASVYTYVSDDLKPELRM